MLVYGDAVRRETVRGKLDRIGAFLDDFARGGGWIVGHGHLVAALIEAGELAQGLADRAFEARGFKDAPSPDADAAMALTLALSRLVATSWHGRAVEPEPARDIVASLRANAIDGDVAIKVPEGFAHYALYPETYLEAARAIEGRDLTVVGIRSIGTTLSGMVAAGAAAPCTMTVRPVGHPFGREIALANGVKLASDLGREVAIVDEGPGLSGSSFLAVADAAGREGIDTERIHLFPSHLNGPGPKASERSRALWRKGTVHVRSFDDLALDPENGRRRLEAWVSDLVGEPTAPIREISGGGWRALRYAEEANWPPVHPWQERRKFLVETSSGTWLLKFVGLGRIGLDKYERARVLADEGFVPRPIGFRHGFIVERWHGDARPLDPFGRDRPRLLQQLGPYLAFRAGAFEVPAERAATLDRLFEMARYNAEEEFGGTVSGALARWAPLLPALQSGMQRCETDNRLHAWEWLVLPGGKILKADALDHHAGHDLIGCQDVSWDIAGATVEFTLSPDEQADVIAAIERLRRIAVGRARVRFATLCYLAFQLGFYREAEASTTNALEGSRLRQAANRYSALLRQVVTGGAEPDRA